MTTTTLALLLVAVLVVLNSVAVIGLIRQVGLLHLRLRPLRAVRDEDGPGIGTHLALDPGQWDFEALDPLTQRIVFAFVSPTCSLCAPLLAGLKRLRRQLAQDEILRLVSDSTRSRAAEYLAGRKIDLPFIAHEDSFKQNRIPGAPYIVITDRAGAVAAAGGVNTLEQVELLIDDARRPLAAEEEGVEAIVVIAPDGRDAISQT